jgi:hypothetical protein
MLTLEDPELEVHNSLEGIVVVRSTPEEELLKFLQQGEVGGLEEDLDSGEEVVRDMLGDVFMEWAP